MLKKPVKKWDDKKLQCCLESTDWDVLTQGSSVEEATDVVTHYISFCEDMIIPTKSVEVFSNNKLWITKAPQTRNEKKIAFNSNIIKSKLISYRSYKERVEKLFREGKAREAWRGVKILAGLPNNNPTASYIGAKDSINMAENLNAGVLQI